MNIPENYVLGNSLGEQERLMLQARVLRPYTERYLRSAGIGPGMRMLDVGSVQYGAWTRKLLTT